MTHICLRSPSRTSVSSSNLKPCLSDLRILQPATHLCTIGEGLPIFALGLTTGAPIVALSLFLLSTKHSGFNASSPKVASDMFHILRQASAQTNVSGVPCPLCSFLSAHFHRILLAGEILCEIRQACKKGNACVWQPF